MFLEYSQALKVFESLPANKQYPTHHPDYVCNEVKELLGRKPCFIFYQYDDDYIYLSGHIPNNKHAIKDFESVRGYGGIISSFGEGKFNDHWQNITQTMQASGFLIGFIRCTPLLEKYEFSSNSHFIDRKTIAIDLHSKQILSSFSTRTRTAIRKATKNHVIAYIADTQSDWLNFEKLYTTRMQSLSASKEYCYSSRYFKALSQNPHAQLMLCKYKQRIVSGAIFIQTGDYVEYHLSASNADGMKYAATQLCLIFAAEYWQQQNKHYLHLGGGISTDENDALLFFKSGFSKDTYDFFYIQWIIDKEKYTQLKNTYHLAGKPTDRTLFYR